MEKAMMVSFDRLLKNVCEVVVAGRKQAENEFIESVVNFVAVTRRVVAQRFPGAGFSVSLIA
ncbi:MAG: hypothetical protein LZF61_02925 [Nitrosomonas sp.]|nr:MAG: hypothetical protein LZF61_02925 [Nitrosomonas sp.]